jgi:O-antigen/teichoic acid export membrane protein
VPQCDDPPLHFTALMRMNFRSLRTVRGALGARVATLPISLVCGLLSVRIVIGDLGASDYGLVALLVGLQLLLPFLDLGTGAAVLNAASSQHAKQGAQELRPVLRQAVKVTMLMSSLTFTAVVAAATAGWWPRLLGFPNNQHVTSSMLLIFGLNIVARPLVIASTALIGLGRATLIILLQGLVPAVGLLVVLLAHVANAPLEFYAVSLIVGQIVTGTAAALVLWRSTRHEPRIANTGSLVASPPLRRTAGPMLAILLMAPLATNLDRLVLSHQSSATQLALYALAVQLFQPVLSVVGVLQQPIWADFAARRASPSTMSNLHLQSLTVFLALGGLAVGGLMTVLVPPVSGIISGQHIFVSWRLALLLALGMALAVALVPASSYLTTDNGLRRQVWIVAFALSGNLALTVFLTPRFGATGPVIGTVCGGVIALVATLTVANRESRLADLLASGR